MRRHGDELVTLTQCFPRLRRSHPLFLGLLLGVKNPLLHPDALEGGGEQVRHCLQEVHVVHRELSLGQAVRREHAERTVRAIGRADQRRDTRSHSFPFQETSGGEPVAIQPDGFRGKDRVAGLGAALQLGNDAADGALVGADRRAQDQRGSVVRQLQHVDELGAERAPHQLRDVGLLQRDQAELRNGRLLARALDHRLLGVLALRHVAGHFREPDQFPALVVHSAQDDARPQPRAVLPDSPALFLETARRRGGLELHRGFSRGSVLLRIEAREVLPDDLRGRVAFHALGAGIPAHDASLGIEHENGVILHAADQQTEPLFAFAQQFRRFALLAQIARHLDESAEVTIRSAQGGDDDLRPEPGTVLPHPPALVASASLAGGALEETRRLA